MLSPMFYVTPMYMPSNKNTPGTYRACHESVVKGTRKYYKVSHKYKLEDAVSVKAPFLPRRFNES